MYAYTMRDCALCMHIRMCNILYMYMYTTYQMAPDALTRITLSVYISVYVAYYTYTCVRHIRWHLAPCLALR